MQKKQDKLRILQFNGMGYSSVHDFIADVATRCTNRKTVPNDPLKSLQHLSKASQTILLVVDEIDAILSKGSRQNHTSTTKNTSGTNTQRINQNKEDQENEEETDVSTISRKPKRGPRRALHAASARNLDRGCETLYRLFTLSQDTSSPLHVIGIANSINTVESSLPMLAKVGAKPQNVVFRTYNDKQIKSLLEGIIQGAVDRSSVKRSRRSGSTKTETASDDPRVKMLFHPGALELVSRTVSKGSGDFRKALELCGSAMDMGMERHDTPKISQTAGTKRIRETTTLDLTPASPLVSMSTMSAVVKGSRFSATTAVENMTTDGLIALFAVFAASNKSGTCASVSDIQKYYNTFSPTPGSGSELHYLLQCLAEQGFLYVKEKKGTVFLKVNWVDVENTVKKCGEGTKPYAVLSTLRPKIVG